MLQQFLEKHLHMYKDVPAALLVTVGGKVYRMKFMRHKAIHRPERHPS